MIHFKFATILFFILVSNPNVLIMPRTSSPKKKSPSEVISNEILNGQSSSGPGVPTQSIGLDLSSNIVDTAASSSSTSQSSPGDIVIQSSTSKSTFQARPLTQSSPKRVQKKPRSPVKGRSLRMVFNDSESEDEGGSFCALKAHYPALNSVEHSSLYNYYSFVIKIQGFCKFKG